MATAGPSTKSYAEVTKAYRPPHAEVLNASRLITKLESRFPTAQPEVDAEDEWTDLSSMISCSWPSTELDDSDMSSLGSSEDQAMVAVSSAWSQENPLDDPDPGDELEGPDTRFARSLASEMNNFARSERRYSRMGRRQWKPWHAFPGRGHWHYKRPNTKWSEKNEVRIDINERARSFFVGCAGYLN